MNAKGVTWRGPWAFDWWIGGKQAAKRRGINDQKCVAMIIDQKPSRMEQRESKKQGNDGAGSPEEREEQAPLGEGEEEQGMVKMASLFRKQALKRVIITSLEGTETWRSLGRGSGSCRLGFEGFPTGLREQQGASGSFQGALDVRSRAYGFVSWLQRKGEGGSKAPQMIRQQEPPPSRQGVAGLCQVASGRGIGTRRKASRCQKKPQRRQQSFYPCTVASSPGAPKAPPQGTAYLLAVADVQP